MDSVDKRIKETIQRTSDQDLYSTGDAQVLSDEALEKAYRLQNEAEEKKKSGIQKETSLKGDYWY